MDIAAVGAPIAKARRLRCRGYATEKLHGGTGPADVKTQTQLGVTVRHAFGGTLGILVAVSHEVLAIPYDGLLNDELTLVDAARKKRRKDGVNHKIDLQLEVL